MMIGFLHTNFQQEHTFEVIEKVKRDRILSSSPDKGVRTAEADSTLYYVYTSYFFSLFIFFYHLDLQ